MSVNASVAKVRSDKGVVTDLSVHFVEIRPASPFQP